MCANEKPHNPKKCANDTQPKFNSEIYSTGKFNRHYILIHNDNESRFIYSAKILL